MWSNPRARATVERQIERGLGKGWIVVGNADGRKHGSHGSKAILLSHMKRVEPPP